MGLFFYMRATQVPKDWAGVSYLYNNELFHIFGTNVVLILDQRRQ